MLLNIIVETITSDRFKAFILNKSVLVYCTGSSYKEAKRPKILSYLHILSWAQRLLFPGQVFKGLHLSDLCPALSPVPPVGAKHSAKLPLSLPRDPACHDSHLLRTSPAHPRGAGSDLSLLPELSARF